MRDTLFPRAIAACVNRARYSCGKLPRGEAALAALDRVAQRLVAAPDEEVAAAGVSEDMDRIQKGLGDVHAQVTRAWFGAGGGQ